MAYDLQFLETKPYICQQKKQIMATYYTIKCPKCGCVFDVVKGVTMSYDFSKPIPVDLREETPFHCPDCNLTMCVEDEQFNTSLLEVVLAD